MTVLTPEQFERRRKALLDTIDAGGSIAEAARVAGISPVAMRHWVSNQGGVEGVRSRTAPMGYIEPAEVREETPQERHDSAFWRRRAEAQRKELDELHRVTRELAALDGLTLRDVPWKREASSHGKGSATLIVHNSDRHYGEVIRADEISGWNAYDVATCERRVWRFMNAACEIGRRWTADTTVDGVLYTMAGDEISGDIHDELRETNELTSLDQVQGAASLHTANIRALTEEYGRVHVMAVPGNHGRTTKKPTAKRYGALSYDILIAKLAARELAGDERVSLQIASGPDALTVIYGRPVLVTHGDKLGGSGGMGFAGPVLPIIRGSRNVREQYGSSTGSPPELILMGHYHTSAAPPGILANGSVPGYSEYGAAIRARFDTPRQWLAVIRSKWGLSERLDVQLEEPVAKAKPRVRVPAA
jgi:hypothetical protein